ncbi:MULTISPECIES: DUF2085 domain-containing protein [Salinibaculum]|uniref:DUF2085 domain-containing protein n=1 Tax=Salinibaculum TaxID=2732368 RepID=UPI0030CA852C
MAVDWGEVRRGLAMARPFLLSHHLPEDYDRCYAPVIRGRTVRVCARCAGIYPGILAGVWAIFAAPALPSHLLLVAVLPAPALVDWSLSAFTSREGSNPGRTATGVLLGYGYGLGLGHLFVRGTLPVVAVGLGYAVLAAGLLWYHDRQA